MKSGPSRMAYTFGKNGAPNFTNVAPILLVADQKQITLLASDSYRFEPLPSALLINSIEGTNKLRAIVKLVFRSFTREERTLA
jgi:hypothetical protein